jgi:GT2 family glycosyltransferase
VNGSFKVSAVIANWNGAHHLRICLPSLLAQTLKPLEIVVVDNGSSDDSEVVTRQFQARWLPLKRNLGLAPALNRGAEVAAGEILLFINNDMRFDPSFVAALAEALDQDEHIFATDGMQFNWDGSVRGHLAARLTKKRANVDSLVELVPGLYFYRQEEAEHTHVFMGSAACMLVRRGLFMRLNGFDARLPLGYEDAEICWRAWIHGWKTVYVPNAVCWHRIGASTRSSEGARLNFRGVLTGRLLFATKLLPLRYAIGTWFLSTLALAKDLYRLRWRFAADRIATLVHVAGLVPQLLREKRALFRNAKSSPQEQLDFLLGLTDEGIQGSREKDGGADVYTSTQV